MNNLKKNEYITEEDLNDKAIKAKTGGYDKINKNLSGLLKEILDIINDEIIVN